MHTSVVRLLPLVCLLLACAGARPGPPPAEAPCGSTVVLLVRHAEKEAGAEDPALTPAGRERAEALREVAGSAGVSAVYTTQLRRTRETAQPLAERLGVPVTVREVHWQQVREHVEAVAREVLSRHRGETVLVVGHSNTVPLLAEALAGVPVPPLPESEYDRLYMVVVPPVGPARLLQARYGAPSVP
jgi:broad specificity phosphatase PhoE